ncbi:MAG: ribonuclease Z [Bdellovibrionales bacterium]|nr:ribonuclease Z [Bdellovibrionales bacterium]
MKLEFIGTGNALDTEMSNCSYFVRGSCNLLVDCGFDTTRRLFEHGHVLDNLDAVYFTHMHGDHTFGFPFLILALERLGRRSPLPVLGQPGTKDFLLSLLRMAYPSVLDRLGFELKFIETTDACSIGGMELSFAKTVHSRSNYAVRIVSGESVIGISGDGALSEESKKLFSDCQLLIHDACTLEEPYQTHESALNVAEYASESCPDLDTLACVHLLELERATKKHSFLALAEGRHFSVIVPEPGDSWGAE